MIAVKQFGEAEVAVVSGATIRGWTPGFEPGQAWRTADLELDENGGTIGGQNWLVIRTPDALVLVDPTQAESGTAASGRATITAGIGLDTALAELSVVPREVTHVVISHFHGDHVTGLAAPGGSQPRFPNAVHIVHSADWQEFVVDDVRGTRDDLMRQFGPAKAAGLLRMVDGDTPVTEGVAVIHTPGESPGHLCVRVGEPADGLYHLADLIHFPIEVEHIDWVAVPGKPMEDLMASRRRIFGEAGRDATFLYTHSRPLGWGRITPAGADSWRWDYVN